MKLGVRWLKPQNPKRGVEVDVRVLTWVEVHGTICEEEGARVEAPRASSLSSFHGDLQKNNSLLDKKLGTPPMSLSYKVFI